MRNIVIMLLVVAATVAGAVLGWRALRPAPPEGPLPMGMPAQRARCAEQGGRWEPIDIGRPDGHTSVYGCSMPATEHAP